MLTFKNIYDLLNQYNCSPANCKIHVYRLNWPSKTIYSIEIEQYHEHSGLKIGAWHIDIEMYKVPVSDVDKEYQIVSQSGKYEISQVEYMQLALKCQEIISNTEKEVFNTFNINLQ